MDLKKPVCPNCGKPMETGKIEARSIIGSSWPFFLWIGSENKEKKEVWGQSMSGARCKECGIVLAHFVTEK